MPHKGNNTMAQKQQQQYWINGHFSKRLPHVRNNIHVTETTAASQIQLQKPGHWNNSYEYVTETTTTRLRNDDWTETTATSLKHGRNNFLSTNNCTSEALCAWEVVYFSIRSILPAAGTQNPVGENDGHDDIFTQRYTQYISLGPRETGWKGWIYVFFFVITANISQVLWGGMYCKLPSAQVQIKPNKIHISPWQPGLRCKNSSTLYSTYI